MENAKKCSAEYRLINHGAGVWRQEMVHIWCRKGWYCMSPVCVGDRVDMVGFDWGMWLLASARKLWRPLGCIHHLPRYILRQWVARVTSYWLCFQLIGAGHVTMQENAAQCDNVIFYVILMILSYYKRWWTVPSCAITFDCSPASFVVKPLEILDIFDMRIGNWNLTQDLSKEEVQE